MLTATPIRDSPDELVDILTLLIRNHTKNPNAETRLVNKAELFQGDQVNTQYLRVLCKGYVSFLRGESPITFPLILDPPREHLNDPSSALLSSVYVPNPRTSLTDGNKFIDFDEISQQHLRLVGCRMDEFQYHNYLTFTPDPV